MKSMRIFCRAFAAAALIAATISCGNVVRSSRAPVMLVINNLQEHTYYANIRIKRGDEVIELDSRPSDAIALAVQFKPPLPIFVEDFFCTEVAHEESPPVAKLLVRLVSPG